VSDRTLARRYAAALLKATEAENTTDLVEQFLRPLGTAYKSNRNFRSMLSQPQISKAKKKELLRKPFAGGGSTAFLNFLDLLVDKNRQSILPEVAEVYDLLADAIRGQVRIQVRTPRPLSEDQKRRLLERVQKSAVRKVLLEEQTNPELLGGMLMYMGYTVIDGTVRYHLKKLGDDLRQLNRR
jgi:F-type H+-transporting ATPase subunit delta